MGIHPNRSSRDSLSASAPGYACTEMSMSTYRNRGPFRYGQGQARAPGVAKQVKKAPRRALRCSSSVDRRPLGGGCKQLPVSRHNYGINDVDEAIRCTDIALLDVRPIDMHFRGGDHGRQRTPLNRHHVAWLQFLRQYVTLDYVITQDGLELCGVLEQRIQRAKTVNRPWPVSLSVRPAALRPATNVVKLPAAITVSTIFFVGAKRGVPCCEFAEVVFA
jgi:hypothetical protein